MYIISYRERGRHDASHSTIEVSVTFFVSCLTLDRPQVIFFLMKLLIAQLTCAWLKGMEGQLAGARLISAKLGRSEIRPERNGTTQPSQGDTE